MLQIQFITPVCCCLSKIIFKIACFKHYLQELNDVLPGDAAPPPPPDELPPNKEVFGPPPADPKPPNGGGDAAADPNVGVFDVAIPPNVLAPPGG